jgi:hypothetical protein
LNSEDINDAELDAFLKGQDDLSRRLRGLEQPSPSVELDAAILARAGRPAAANDPTDDAARQLPMPRLGLRWRLPAGIAATVLAGVLAHQVWQASADMDRTGQARLAEALPSPPPPPPALPTHHTPEATGLAPPAKAIPPTSKLHQPAARHIAPQVAERVAAPAQAHAPALAPAPAPPPLPAPAPAPAVDRYRYAAPAMADERRAVEVTTQRSRSEAVPVLSNEAKSAARPDPNIWLAAIDEMIKAGLRRDAVEEWDRFRAAWPDYPVPPETSEKINALRK